MGYRLGEVSFCTYCCEKLNAYDESYMVVLFRLYQRYIHKREPLSLFFIDETDHAELQIKLLALEREGFVQTLEDFNSEFRFTIKPVGLKIEEVDGIIFYKFCPLCKGNPPDELEL